MPRATVIWWLLGRTCARCGETNREIVGLMKERLYVDSRPLGTTKLSDWVEAHRETLGRRYTSELARRVDRSGAYRSN